MAMETTCGCREVEIADPIQGATFPLAFLYPARAPEREEQFGPYALAVAGDAEPVGEHLPLVAISHGHGGTPWVYRDLARHLARAGFAVALPEHPGNSRKDNSLAWTAANLENRPRHISLTIDAALADAVLQQHIASTGVGVIGHSIGGYTALALAGGEPWASAQESADGTPHPVCVERDARVRSLVLLMPAAFWFPAGSLRQVRVPILMRAGENDEMTPPAHVEAIQQGVADPALVEYGVIPGAGHFAVLSTFPPEMTRPDFPPSQDPPEFDRAAFQPALFADITDFLRRTL